MSYSKNTKSKSLSPSSLSGIHNDLKQIIDETDEKSSSSSSPQLQSSSNSPPPLQIAQYPAKTTSTIPSPSPPLSLSSSSRIEKKQEGN